MDYMDRIQVTDVGPGAIRCGRCVLLGTATGYRPHRLRLWKALRVSGDEH